MFCAGCGKNNEPAGRFCMHCGAPMPASEPPPSTSPIPSPELTPSRIGSKLGTPLAAAEPKPTSNKMIWIWLGVAAAVTMLATIPVSWDTQRRQELEQRAAVARVKLAEERQHQKEESDKAEAERKMAEWTAKRPSIIKEVKGKLAAKQWEPAYDLAHKWAAYKDAELGALEQLARERYTAYKVAADQREKDQEAKAERDRRRKEGVSLGMTREEVVMSSWGRPESINVTEGRFGRHEQWVYQGSQYLYFEDGRLTSMQTRH
jgi:hypothetical protein